MLLLCVCAYMICGFLKLTSAATCDLDNLPLQNNFDMKRFLGTWYEEERTELQWGQNTWHSAIWNIFKATNGTTYFSYLGYSQNKGCSSPETGFFTDSTLNGRVTLTSEGGIYELTFQVAYTDYTHFALVYMCYEPPKLAGCHRNKMHVSFLSRQSPLTSTQRSTLVSHLDNTCITETDVIKASTGLCVAPTPDPVYICVVTN